MRKRGDHVVVEMVLGLTSHLLTTYVDEIDAISSSKQNKCLFLGYRVLLLLLLCALFLPCVSS
jgi:hypothetical protein